MKKCVQSIFSLLLLVMLSACVNMSAPIEDVSSFPVPEPPKEVIPTLNFTLGIYSEESLHPTLVKNETNLTLAPLLYEGLYVLDENFEPQSVMVESYQVENDGYRWVFTLKEGITLWNGRDLTGQMVASALTEAKNQDSRYASRFTEIGSIAGSTNTVTVYLLQPNGNLPALLDIPISYGGGDLPQGTGPYEYVAGSFKLQLREDWWQGDGGDLPQEILLAPLYQEGDLVAAFDAGELSILPDDLTGQSRVSNSGNYEVWSYHSTQLFYLGLSDHNPDLTSEVRRLISLGIDRDALIDHTLAGYGTATAYPIHPVKEKALPLWNYDPIFVAEEYFMAESEVFSLIVNGENQEKTLMAEEIAKDLATFGLQLEVVPLSWSEYQSALNRGDFDLYLGELYMTPDFNCADLFKVGGIHNYGDYSSEILLQLWQEYRRFGDEVLENDSHFFQYFLEDLPFVPICFKDGTMLSLWGHLKEAYPTANHLLYDLEHWVVAEFQ